MTDQPRHAIVTGAASGIGLATAQLLASGGWRVSLWDRDEAALSRAEGFVGTAAFRVPLDVSSEASVISALRDSEAALGPVSGVVNSAGLARDVPFIDTTADMIRQIHEVNVVGSFLVAREVVRSMIGSGIAGAVVNIASVSGTRGNLGRSAYGASKGAIITLTQVMAVELAEHGIRVNAVAPGPVDTPLVQALHTPNVRHRWMERTPMKRYSQPNEIAHAISFLLDGVRASYITGQILAVDGGFEAGGLIR